MIGVVVLALLVRAGILLLVPGSLSADPDGYRHLAEHVLEHGSLGSAGIPSAYRPPLYPLLLAAGLAFGQSSRLTIGVLHLVLGMGTVWLVYRLGQRWGLGNYALLAAALVACDPILLSQSALIMTETLATLLAVASLICLSWAAERLCAARATLAGGCLGLAVLCRPTFLLWTAVAAVLLPAFAHSWPQRLKQFGAFVAAVVVVLAPWAIRNQIQLGRPVITTTHGGYTLLLGNNSSFYEYLRSRHWGTVWNADQFIDGWAKRASRTSGADEIRNDRLAYAEAWRNICNQPGMFLYSCLIRMGRLWQLLPHQVDANESSSAGWLRYAVGLWYLVEFVLAVAGVFSGWRVGAAQDGPRGSCGLSVGQSREPSQATGSWWTGWVWGLLLAVCFTAVHALYWTNMRMRAPLMPVVALAAAAGVAAIMSGAVERKLSSKSMLRT